MSLHQKLLALAGLAAIATSFTVFAATEESTVEERLAPVGELCMAGDPCAATLVVTSDTSPRSGQQVYEASCAMCHASGVSGAPIVGDEAAWEPRLAKGLDTLRDHAWNGFNMMPAKGGCATCSREEMDNAVAYMVEQVQ